MPKTVPGKISFVLIFAVPIFFVLGRTFLELFYESIPSGNTILEDISGRPALAISMLAGMASGVSAFIIGMFAIITKKDRSVLVILATILGGLFTLFLIAELMFPH